MMNRKNIVVAGAYGIQNAGDDAPMLVLKDLLESRSLNEICITVLARHVLDYDKIIFGSDIVKNLEYESRDDALGKWFNGFNFDDDRAELKVIKEKIREADLLVIGAGNAFIDISIDLFRGPIPLMAIYCFLAELYEVPIFFYGVSVGPITSSLGEDLSKWMLRRAAVISVRDEGSFNYVKTKLKIDRPVSLLPDPVLGLKPKPISPNIIDMDFIKSEKAKGKLIVGVGLRDISSVVPEGKRNEVFSEIRKLFISKSDVYTPIFIPNSTYPEDNDCAIALEVSEGLDTVPKQFVHGRVHPAELVSLYKLCDFGLTIRLHAAVFCVLADIPLLALSYLPKVKGFTSNLGAGVSCIDIENVTVESMSIEIERILNEPNSKYEAFGSYVEKARNEIVEYADLMLANLKVKG